MAPGPAVLFAALAALVPCALAQQPDIRPGLLELTTSGTANVCLTCGFSESDRRGTAELFSFSPPLLQPPIMLQT